MATLAETPNRVADLEEAVREVGRALATRSDVPPSVVEVVANISDAILGMSENLAESIDPYLLLGLENGALGAVRALDLEDPRQRRDQLRVRLEQIRQALRDIEEGWPVGEERPAKDVAQWLASQLDAPQAVLAELVGTSPRTFQRWISHADASAPRGEEASRVRIVARIANQLRHALTGRGVVNWFYRPHPELKGEAPVTLLGQPESVERLSRLAVSLRSGGAA
jgi:uncharacterized protein (DUF2384 family)